MDINILKHAKLLEGRDPEEVKKFISFLISLLYKLQHTTSDMGIFFGGFYKGCELFMSFIHHNIKIPTHKELKGFKPDLLPVMPPYVDLSFQMFEDWKRESEQFQVERDVMFKLFELALAELYKNYQKRSQR